VICDEDGQWITTGSLLKSELSGSTDVSLVLDVVDLVEGRKTIASGTKARETKRAGKEGNMALISEL
jgi:hypothetical protein